MTILHIHSLAEYDETLAIAYKMMKFSGIRVNRNDSPTAKKWWNFFFWFQFINLMISFYLNSMRFREIVMEGSFDDITRIFRMLPCMGYMILAMVKTYKMVLQRSVFENLINELRGMWPQGHVLDDDHQVLKNALTEINYSVRGYYICNYLLGVSFIVPFYINVVRRALGTEIPRVLPYNYWMPFNQTSPGYYEFTLTLQFLHTVSTLFFMLSSDLLFCIFLSHISTQFDLMSNRIKRLILVPTDQQLIKEYPLGAYYKATTGEINEIDVNTVAEDEIKIKTELVFLIMRHRALIRLANDVEEMFSFALFINFAYSSIIICFCAFCCVQIEKWNEIMYKLFLTTTLSQVWLMSWHGNKLIEASNGFSVAIYNSGWYAASQKIKTILFIMMYRSQKPVFVTTYGFAKISLMSYTTIIKTAWSYFTLLLNTYQPN
ncbi:hypothetical protein ACJJTC_014140 [Scirpophaga incertulas]